MGTQFENNHKQKRWCLTSLKHVHTSFRVKEKEGSHDPSDFFAVMIALGITVLFLALTQ
jgi:hypothetical protein